MTKLGILYGISVGTGDPELITLKGLRLLKSVPIVAFPLGVGNKPGMAEQIVSPWLDVRQQKVGLHFPYVRDEEILERAWQAAATKVWHYLETGRDVAFVCEGDGSFYSTFNYLAQTLTRLHPEVAIETVPGVSSPMAAAASLGLPLTVRHQRLAVLPALYNLEELENVLTWADVIVLMKVSSVYREVWQVLQKHNLLDRSAIVERVTLPEQKIYRDLQNFPNLELSYFSVLIVWIDTRSEISFGYDS